jgi:hypothetical protein
MARFQKLLTHKGAKLTRAMALGEAFQRVGWVERKGCPSLQFAKRWVSRTAQPILRASAIEGGFGCLSPSIAPLIRDIEAWARESGAIDNPERRTVRRFVAGDWEIELDLFSGGSIQHNHAIGVSSGGVGWIAPHIDLRDALELKAKRYGDLRAPYLIVVADSKKQIFGTNEVKDVLTGALLGDEIVQMRQGEEPKLARRHNGFWRGPKSPRNKIVSGVMLFPDIGLWGLRSEHLQPILALNPWAECPLPDVLRTLGRFESKDEQWKFQEGRSFADIIGLPASWPPQH